MGQAPVDSFLIECSSFPLKGVWLVPSWLLGAVPALWVAALIIAVSDGGATHGTDGPRRRRSVGYVTGPGTFPRPLSPADEARYLEAMAAGSHEARNVLVERNLRLVAHIVKKFSNTRVETEDLISIGTVGLIKGINTFNPDRGTRLATYAARCIQNEILMYLRSTRSLHSEVHLYDPIGVDREGNELTLIDVLCSDEDMVPDLVGTHLDEQKVRDRVAALTGKERQVLELRYGIKTETSQTQREIARDMGISRSYVSRIEKKALGHLKRELRSEIYHLAGPEVRPTGRGLPRSAR
jgi:RNA polymerase sporulation-specific sigma factor